MIKQFEGCELTAYKDPVGVYTIGFGHTGPDVHEGVVWTQAEADSQLAIDVNDKAQQVSKLLTRQVTQNQFDALVSFAYNVGVGAFATSSLLRLVNGGEEWVAVLMFTNWVHAGSEILPGLVRRRLAEANLFVDGLG